MSYTSCRKKAGAALRSEDDIAIFALSRQYRSEGMRRNPDAAAIKAIEAQQLVVNKAIEQEQLAQEELLKAPTKEEILAKQEKAAQEAKEAKAKRREEAEKAQAEDDRKRIAKASEDVLDQQDGFALSQDSPEKLRQREEAAQEAAAQKAAQNRAAGAIAGGQKRKLNNAEEKARAEQVRKERADAAVEDFAANFGGDAPSSKVSTEEAAGQGGLFANENVAAYNAPYEQDLFGSPLPAQAGKVEHAKSERKRVLGNVQPAKGLPDTPIPRGDYFTNTILGKTSQRELGAKIISTAQHAAQATRYLYKSAVERLDGIVTDKNHRPLAIVGGFKGALSQAAVYPSTLIGEAIRIPGAAHIWFSHNHPSGNVTLSRADENLNRVLSDVFRGSGIKPMGLLAVAGGKFSHVGSDGNINASHVEIGESTGTSNVPVVERQISDSRPDISIGSPIEAKSVGAAMYAKAKEPGIILTDSQNAVVAWVPITKEMMGPLRDTGALASIYRSVSQANAGSAFIIHGGELNSGHSWNDADGRWKSDLPENVSASENIAAALQKVDVRALDSINVKTNQSVAEQGRNVARGPMFARTLGPEAFSLKIAPRPTGMPLNDVQKAVSELSKTWKSGPTIKVVARTSDLPVRAPTDARGMIHKGTAYVVASKQFNRGDVARTLAHEAIGHYGLWKSLGKDGSRQFRNNLQLALKSGNKPLKAISEQVRALYVDDNGNFNLSLAEEADEIAAFAVEQALDADGNFNPGFGFLKQVWAKIADFLRELGFTIKFTNVELHGMLVASMRGLEAGNRLDGGGEVMVAAHARVWHGSPHKFYKFDSSKIGTGEGAQAYGHGLYLAESDGVAKSYAEKLGRPSVKIDGRVFTKTSDGQRWVGEDGGMLPSLSDLTTALNRVEDAGYSVAPAISRTEVYSKTPGWADDSEGVLKLLKSAEIGYSGSLYKVDLPDEYIAKMLDWDKQISQSQLDALKIHPELSGMINGYKFGSGINGTTGEMLYRQLGRFADDATTEAGQFTASDLLKKAGIPGIRYLDGGSRGAGAGSSNYVIFPGMEHILTILDRNGEPVPDAEREAVIGEAFARGTKKTVTSPNISEPSISDSPKKWKSITDSWIADGAHVAEKVLEVGEISIFKDTRKNWNRGDDGQLFATNKKGEVVGQVFFGRREDGRLEGAVEVAPAYRRQGIASAMYDTIEKMRGETLAPAQGSSNYAKAFWADRTKNNPIAARGTNGAMTNNDVVGNQGGRSADDSTGGAAPPPFSDWFKGSKIVDAAGKPLVVYHGTQVGKPGKSEAIDSFSMNGAGSATWFTQDPKRAGEYAKIQLGEQGRQAIYPVLLNLKNPLIVDAEGRHFTNVNGGGHRADTGRYAGKWVRMTPEGLVPATVEDKPRDINSMARLAKRNGHDGLWVKNVIDPADRSNADKVDSIAVFDPENIRSAIQPNEPTAPDSGGAFARGGNLFAPTVWNTPDPTRTDKIIYELQDGRVDLKRVQQAIEKSGQQIAEKWDARLAETLYPGRVAYRSQQFLEADVKPLLKSMAVYGVPMDELADYLHARGAEERNAQVAKVNRDLPDGGAGKNTKGVLLTNQAARDYLASVKPTRKQVLDVLAAKVDAITAETRNLLVSEGLEKQETIDAWTKTYKNYVPMFRDEAESGAPHPHGSGFMVKGSASKRATGSTKEVTNILAHVLMQREAAITRAEKNRVALSLYGQALSHPNPEFWTTIKPSMTAAKIGAELQRMGVDPATAIVGMELTPTITTVDEATGKKVNRPNPMYKSLPGAIPLKVNGEDRVLMLNTEHERGARLAENMKNLDGLTKLDLANTIIGKSTRWLASVNTQYNPAFGLVNLTRDVLGGAINLGSTELSGKALWTLSRTPAAIWGIARELSSNNANGKWSKLYRQFQADGGQTGFKENFRDAGDRAKAIEKELAGMERGKLHPGRVTHAILDLLDGFNTTLENAVRLSAYKAALDKGMSGAQAARLGRELTVDFNRKGRAGREAGPLYAFFNASVQGMDRTIQTIKGPTGAKVIVGGLGLGFLQAMMLAVAGYDDDEIPEFVKTRALIVPMFDDKKTYVSIPYPLGLHVLPNMGRVLAELVLNGGKNIGKRTAEAIGEIASAFNPLGGGNIFTADGALKTVAPTLIDPLIEIGFNKNFAGNTIEKAPYRGETDTRPGFERAKESTQRSTTGQAYLGISKVINTMTGGDDYEAGMVSPTPERLRYIAQTVGGGVLREIEKTINASTASSRGEDVKMSQIPVAGRFYGEVDADQVKTSRYFENAKKIDALETTVKAIIKSGDTAAFEKLQKDHPEIALINLGNRVQSAVSKLNKIAVQTINDTEAIQQVDQSRVEVMDLLNEAVKNLEDSQGKPTTGDKIRGWRKEPVTQ